MSEAFDPDGLFVPVEVSIFGPLGRHQAVFVLDTGSPVTVIDPVVVDRAGYGPRMGTVTSHLAGVAGSHPGYRIHVARLEALGCSWEPCEVWCHDLPTELGVYGLIGLDLLRHRVLTIDFVAGAIELAKKRTT